MIFTDKILINHTNLRHQRSIAFYQNTFSVLQPLE